MPCKRKRKKPARPTNGFSEYKKYILYKLDENAKHIASIDTKMDKLTSAIVELKVKERVFAAVAGLSAGGVMAAIIKVAF